MPRLPHRFGGRFTGMVGAGGTRVPTPLPHVAEDHFHCTGRAPRRAAPAVHPTPPHRGHYGRGGWRGSGPERGPGAAGLHRGGHLLSTRGPHPRRVGAAPRGPTGPKAGTRSLPCTLPSRSCCLWCDGSTWRTGAGFADSGASAGVRRHWSLCCSCKHTHHHAHHLPHAMLAGHRCLRGEWHTCTPLPAVCPRLAARCFCQSRLSPRAQM
jgi:hypothetical protein